jgi:hypothetical protein
MEGSPAGEARELTAVRMRKVHPGPLRKAMRKGEKSPLQEDLPEGRRGRRGTRAGSGA